MRHHNSVFHQIQQHVDWTHFDQLVDKHGADHRVRRLTTKSQFLALLFAQLSGAHSLREIEGALASHQNRLYHVGGRPVARTTLADANAKRPAALFEDLFAAMVAKAGRATRRHMRDAVRLLDATRIRLSSFDHGWANMVCGHNAIKLHIAYDPHADLPDMLAITGQRTSDLAAIREMTIEAGMTYVFDLAYYDFGWWASMHDAGCRFVTRLKSHTKLSVIADNPVDKADRDILSDRIGHLPQRMARSRSNPMANPVREIIVTISTGKTIRIVTNDLDAPARQIADLYKQRWQIELFFKWIKQNLKIGHFLGTSQNAVRIQIHVALIAYVLLRQTQACQTTITRPLDFARLVRINLMHRRPVNALHKPDQPPPINTNQMELTL